MTAAQTSIPFKGANRLSGPLAIVAAGLMVAVVGVAISARPVAAPASVASVNSAPLTLGHDEHAVGVNSAPLTLGHDEHAAGGYSIVPSTLDKHAEGQFPIAPRAPRMGGGSRPS